MIYFGLFILNKNGTTDFDATKNKMRIAGMLLYVKDDTILIFDEQFCVREMREEFYIWRTDVFVLLGVSLLIFYSFSCIQQ